MSNAPYQIAAEVEASPLEDEVASSFAQYTSYVIMKRALPDVRDGLKPVQRCILYAMSENNLTPKKSHTKSARIVGDVIGRYHPHGDSAVYDAMVRMAQGFAQNLPTIDGHGNFGSPGNSAAAARYTEARMSPWGDLMTAELSHKVVPTRLNFDETLEQPVVLPAQVPHLLINGTKGIAVAMATNMVPHNPVEAITAVIYQLENQDEWEAYSHSSGEDRQAALETLVDHLVEIMPAPDFPTGAKLLGLDGAREAYMTGTGRVVLQAKYRLEDGPRGGKTIVFHEIPYGTSAEEIKMTLVENEQKYLQSKRILKENGGKGKIEGFKIEGVTSADDFSDKTSATALSVTIDAKTNPEAVIAELYKRTSLQESYPINQNCLVQDTPKVVNLPELIQQFISFRRRIKKAHLTNMLEKTQSRLHIINGLLKVLIDIDQAIAIIRGSESQKEAQDELERVFSLDEVQAKHVLDTALRRLTKLDTLELNKEQSTLQEQAQDLQEKIGSRDQIDAIIAQELRGIIAKLKESGVGERRSEIVSGTLSEHAKAQKSALKMDREVTDDPVRLCVDHTGKVRRTDAQGYVTAADTTTLGQYVAITNRGRGMRGSVLDLIEGKEVPGLQEGERVVVLSSGAAPITVGTRHGVVYTFQPNYPGRSDEFEVMSLGDGDELVGGAETRDDAELVFLTSEGNVLRFPQSKVAAKQSLGGKGMAGIKVPEGERVMAFSVVPEEDLAETNVVTSTGVSVKAVPLAEFPTKGRGTGGVRAHKFLKGEQGVTLGAIGERVILRDDSGKRLNPVRFLTKREASGKRIGDVNLVSAEFAAE